MCILNRFKNGIELENAGTNGTLMFTAVQKSDSGSYHCYTETDAGVTLSEDVQVEVKGNFTFICICSIIKCELIHDCSTKDQVKTYNHLFAFILKMTKIT